jgi:hypothetical protein
MTISSSDTFTLPKNLRGRSIQMKVIPTVCNLKNMINKLEAVNGEYQQLKPWEKRSFKAYQIEKIKRTLLSSSSEQRPNIIKHHIVTTNPNDLGASCLDIYLVAYVGEYYGPGKLKFFEYIMKSGISEKENSAQAIWQVGKEDGVYLGVLNDDGSIRDWDFFSQWAGGRGI